MSYDYVIVGAGSAGCVLANRLSEDRGASVLLLEAGPSDRKQEIHVPAAFGKLFKTELDWAYHTERQARLDGRRLFWPRGKMLGGCSSLNAMIYIRGHRRDYDRWAELGCTGWGWDDVLPYFLKSENQERGASELHGTGGELNVADLRDPNPLSRAFVDAAAEEGFERNDDFNGERMEGVGLYQVTQRGGKRCSTAVAFLKPALGRPNLTVEVEAHVRRVTFEERRASGVEYLQGGEVRTATARREVILAGGAVNSPQILMLSGVGPGAHLGEMEIPVVHDLPGVGSNLHDHPIAPLVYVCRQPVSLAGAEKLGYIDHGFVTPEGDGFTIGPVLLTPASRGELRLRSKDPGEAPSMSKARSQVPPAGRLSQLAVDRDEPAVALHQEVVQAHSRELMTSGGNLRWPSKTVRTWTSSARTR